MFQMTDNKNRITNSQQGLSKANSFIWILFLYIIYLLFKTPLEVYNLGIANIESYYLADSYSVLNGCTLYKDIYQNKGPLQILFYVLALYLGELDEFSLIRVRLLQSFTYLIPLTCLTLSANIIFKNKLVTLLTPALYIYLPVTFKGFWGIADLQVVTLPEGELIMAPWVSLSLYFLVKYFFTNKSNIFIFLSGIFSSLATLTKLSGASFCLAVIAYGIILLLLLRKDSPGGFLKDLILFTSGTALPILVFYVVLFLQSSIPDHNFFLTSANINRGNLTLSPFLKKWFLPILYKNYTTTILFITYFFIITFRLIKHRNNLTNNEHFEILLLLWSLISICVVLAPKSYAAHYYQGFYLAAALPLALTINRILSFRKNLIYRLTIIIVLILTTWNKNLFQSYISYCNRGHVSILAANKQYNSNVLISKEMTERWLGDNQRNIYLKVSDIIRWLSTPNNTMYLWPGKSFVYLYSHVKPAICRQPEMFLSWILSSGLKQDTQEKLLKDYFLKTKNELVKKEPDLIVDTTPLLKEFADYSIFHDEDFQKFLSNKYSLIFNLQLIAPGTMDTVSDSKILFYKKKAP